MRSYNAIGLMSGTSLDGLDIAACHFELVNGKWSFDIEFCHTFPYSPEWKDKLAALPGSDALTFSRVNAEYGHLLGKLTLAFINATGFKPDLIASHGHTIFHQPAQGLTVQIGSGSAIAAETGYPVICDFRTMDVALGGQGAPLVPIGDKLLFSEYDACLNLGGFANISLDVDNQRIAFDICPANIILNQISSQIGLEFDRDGQIARSGNLNDELLTSFNNIDYYHQKYPKSLGREWLEQEMQPLCSNYSGPLNDLLRTLCEHIAIQVNRAVIFPKPQKIMVTGGGAHNVFLMERIRNNSFHNWIISSDKLADYKEALVFAFLGVLRWRNEVNLLRTVTGARLNHSGGAIYRPF